MLLGFNANTPFQQDVPAAQKLMADANQAGGFALDLLVPTGAGREPDRQAGWQLTPQAEHDGFFYALLQKHR